MNEKETAMSENRNIRLLIERARARDEDAFAAIFNMHVDKVFGYALSRTSNRDVATDITQETFLGLWNALPSFTYRGEEAFLGFIFIILKRRIVHHHKLRARDAAHTTRLDDVDAPHMPAYNERADVNAAILTLPSKDQEVLKLRYWGTLSFAEIGETLGIQESTARVLHHRALKKLHTVITS